MKYSPLLDNGLTVKKVYQSTYIQRIVYLDTDGLPGLWRFVPASFSKVVHISMKRGYGYVSVVQHQTFRGAQSEKHLSLGVRER